MTDHSVKDGTGDPILGSEVDVNPNLLADILDGTQATDLGGAGTVDFLALRVLDLDNAAGSVQTNLTLEWDPGDGGNLTDNSSGIGIDFKMPDDADNQIVFGSLDVMCVSDANGSERGGFSFRAQSGGGSESEIATLETGLTTTGTVLTLATAEPTVVDGDVLGRIDFQAPSEGSGTDAILVAASIYAEADDTFAADNNDADLVFAVAESEAAAERMRLSYDGTNVGLTFSGATTVTTGSGAMTLTSPAAATWSTAAGALTISGNAGVNIQEDGTDVIAIDTSRAVALTLGSDATGDIIYRNASGKLARLAVGSDGEVLKLASGLPSWAADTAGVVDSIANGADNRIVTFSDSDSLNGEANLTFDGSTLVVAGDVTLYDDANNADVSLTMGTSSAESLAIQVLNGSSNKTAEEVKFVTATASGTANHGKMTFNVDGTDIISIDDGGIDMLANGNQLTLDTDGDTSIRASADDQIDWKVGTGDVMKLVAAGGASPKLTLTAAATSHSSLMDFAGPANGGSVIGIAFVEGDGDGSSNNMKYQFGYLGGGNYVSLDSWNIDGSAGRADIFRVPDGQLSIDANTTWDANVFDYVCSSDECGWHDAHEVDECPLCGSDVEWHDDADLLDRALHLPAKRNDALATLERLGVVNTYGTLNSEKPEVFTSLPNAHMFTFSAVAQLHRRISELERKVA
tara:strand:- start:1957 stop:4023 length:2067 start_codon:yes stop_codon:yes gene_type:complete